MKNKNKLRFKRKGEHLVLAAQGARCSFNNCGDIVLPHNCLTEVNPRDVDLSTSVCGIPVTAPLYINAITGGALVSESINRILAQLAATLQLPMAVGSQMSAIKQPSLRFTYQVVRKYNPHGLVMANLSATATPQQAQQAIDMVQAQILQLHLNPAQEFIMPEGSKVFPGLLDNISEICHRVDVPVIAKEVGFGIGAGQAQRLAEAGVQAVDVSGTGGTNFARIEGLRNKDDWWHPLEAWGLPTPLCVADVATKVSGVEVLASGGLDDGISALKALILGARAVGTAGALWQRIRQGRGSGRRFLQSYLHQLRVAMALVGCRNTDNLAGVPLLITGRMKDMFELKSIDPQRFA